MANEDLKKFMKASVPAQEDSMFRKFITENTDLTPTKTVEENFMENWLAEFDYHEDAGEVEESYMDLFDEFSYPMDDMQEKIAQMRLAMDKVHDRVSKIENDSDEMDESFVKKVRAFDSFLSEAMKTLEQVDRAVNSMSHDFHVMKETNNPSKVNR